MKIRLDDRVATITQKAQERLYGRTIKFGDSDGRIIEYGQIIIPYDLYAKNTDELKNLGFKITHTHTSPRGVSEKRETYEFGVQVKTSTLIRDIADGINSNHLGQYNKDLAIEIGQIVGVESLELEKFSNDYTNKVNKLHKEYSSSMIKEETSSDMAINKIIKSELSESIPRYIKIDCNLKSIKK